MALQFQRGVEAHGGMYAAPDQSAEGAPEARARMGREEKRSQEMTQSVEPRSLPAPRSKGCAFCEQPAQTQWVGGDDLEEVVVYCCAEHQNQGRERWDELYTRMSADLES